MVRDKEYYQNIKSKKFKEDNYKKGNKKRGWIKNSKKNFNEQSPYSNWVENGNKIDPIDTELLTDDETPWSMLPLSDNQEDQLDALEELYGELQGRQKELVNLLFRGYTNQAAIAFVMQIKPQQITKILKAIKAKIEVKIQNEYKTY